MQTDLQETVNRKKEHIRIAISSNIESDAGFGKIKLKHRALPEIDFDEISLEKFIFGKKLNYPIIIEGITGGTKEGKFINRVLSKLADEYKIGFMVGSERAVTENESLKETFEIYGKPPLIIGNLGAVQLNYGYTVNEYKKAVNLINADAIALHLNPLQECFQPNGNKNFKNLKKKINEISYELQKEGIKVIVKEVGNGLSYDDVFDLDVNGVDVAGKGGTNWAVIEGMRNKNLLKECSKNFYDWGIQTVDALLDVIKIKEKRNITIIASGGIRNGVQAAKCFAIGADAVGMAMPFLIEIYKNNNSLSEKKANENLRKFLDKFILELKIAMFLSGSKNVDEMKGKYFIDH